MNFQDEYLKKEQKDDICKQYCGKHKIIYFLCTYPVQISWGLTIFIASLFTIIGVLSNEVLLKAFEKELKYSLVNQVKVVHL